MRLEVENKRPVENATEEKVRSAILNLRSYGPSSFASLTSENGNYLQVAGGGVTCMIERRDASGGHHYRGYQDKRSQVFPDGTALVFGGGEVRLTADEWFTADQSIEVFLAFLHGAEAPGFVKWRDISEMFRKESEGKS